MPDNSVQNESDLLKKREEELRQAYVKLHERDETLSKINQEVYKKNLELLEEKRKAEALLFNINEAVLVTNGDYEIILFNRAAQSLVATKEESVIGKKFKEVVDVYDKDGVRITNQVISGMLEYKSGVKLSDLTLKRADGAERYVTLTASKVAVADETFFVVIISDVTEQKKTERAREEFISVASHELRTPMTIIKNYLWMLENRKGGNLSPKQEEYVTKAAAGTDRMIKLIHDMLDVSKMELGKYDIKISQVNLAAMIGELAADFRLKAEEKKINFGIDVPGSLPFVFADEDRLREVLVNLLSNAFKFTDAGFVELRAAVEGKFVRVSVADTGRGIKQDDIPKLFLKFGRLDNTFTTVAEQGGTGLGLYIVKSIVEAMGGKVGVISEGVGKGATFWFTLRSL